MITLKNNSLEITISNDGAQIVDIHNHSTKFLHDANPKYWSRVSPVLFPIVGKLAKDTYLHNNKEYTLSSHGFARDMKFELINNTDTSATFELNSNEETLSKYPFEFKLQISYELINNEVFVKWNVFNTSTTDTMYFSIGAHPAFLLNNTSIDNFSLEFKNSKSIESYEFNNDTGQVFENKVLVHNSSTLPLSNELFVKHPVLILDNESEITLKQNNSTYNVTTKFDNFPLVGIWTPMIDGSCAPFVCIEPWYGVADSKDEPQEISQKRAIQKLQPNSKFSSVYSMTFNS